jgi:hypothetical protein
MLCLPTRVDRHFMLLCMGLSKCTSHGDRDLFDFPLLTQVPLPSPKKNFLSADSDPFAGFNGSNEWYWNGNRLGPLTKMGLPDMRFSENRAGKKKVY